MLPEINFSTLPTIQSSIFRAKTYDTRCTPKNISQLFALFFDMRMDFYLILHINAKQQYFFNIRSKILNFVRLFGCHGSYFNQFWIFLIHRL